METIIMWLESPISSGALEFDADSLTDNLEDFLNQLIESEFDTFKLYSGVTNAGPIGLIAEVKNNKIVEFDIDEYLNTINSQKDMNADDKKLNDNSPDMIYAEKMTKVMLNKGMDKNTIIDVLISSGLTKQQAESLLLTKTKDTNDVFIKDDDYDKAQVRAYKMLIGSKKPFAVIYAYNQGKGKVLLNPPLIKKSAEEVQGFLNGFRRGKEGTQVTVDVFYASQIDKIKNALIDRGLIKNDSTKDSNLGRSKLKVGQVVHIDKEYISSSKRNNPELDDNYIVEGFWYKGELIKEDIATENVRDFSGVVIKSKSTGRRLSVNRYQLKDECLYDSKGYDIMQLCIRNDWYTRGSREDYEKLLNDVDNGMAAEDVAMNIWKHSATSTKYSDVLTEVKKIIKDSVKTNDEKTGKYFNKLDNYFKSKYPGMEWEMERVGYARVYDPKTFRIIKSGIPVSSILLQSKDSVKTNDDSYIGRECANKLEKKLQDIGIESRVSYETVYIDQKMDLNTLTKMVKEVISTPSYRMKKFVPYAKDFIKTMDDGFMVDFDNTFQIGKKYNLFNDSTQTKTKTKKYNRHCGYLVTDSLKDADDDLTTGRSYFKAIRKLLYEYLGTDENYGDQWLKKDNNSVIDMYSWIEKQEPAEDYKKYPQKTLKLEQQQFENILNDICEELNCSWERSYEGTSEGSSTWFHDATALNNNKEYDDYCIADYRIILPEGITKWTMNNELTTVDLSSVKDSKKVKNHKLAEDSRSSLYYKVLKMLDGKKITKDNANEYAKKVGLSVDKLYDVLDDLVNDQYIYGNNETLVYRIPYGVYLELPNYEY